LRQAGEHLGSELLQSYQRGEVSPLDARMVEAHTAACARCHSRLQMLKRFALEPKPAESQSPVRSESQDATGAPVRWARWLGSLLWSPSLAYALAGLLLILNLLSPVPPDVRTLGDDWSGSVRLDASGPVQVSAAQEVAELEIPLEPLGDAARFRVTLRNESQTRMIVDELQRPVSEGALAFALPPGWLTPDRYQLVVESLGAPEARITSFEVAVEP
jgi:hypothetical protein